MTTATELPLIAQVDAALDEIQQARAEVVALPPSVGRSLHLAELAEVEAAWWEALSERSRTRVQWRAALVAREHALHTARFWRRHAATQPAAPLPEAGEVS